jgi:hypothetical protein
VKALLINKGPDWTAAQGTAAAIGFFAAAGIGRVLVAQGYTTRNWAVILMAIGLCVPPAIVRWLDVRKRQKSGVP